MATKDSEDITPDFLELRSYVEDKKSDYGIYEILGNPVYRVLFGLLIILILVYIIRNSLKIFKTKK